MEKINEDSLNQVAGGYLFDASKIQGSDPKQPWEIIGPDGDVRGRFSKYEDAFDTAKKISQDPVIIGWEKVQELRTPKH